MVVSQQWRGGGGGGGGTFEAFFSRNFGPILNHCSRVWTIAVFPPPPPPPTPNQHVSLFCYVQKVKTLVSKDSRCSNQYITVTNLFLRFWKGDMCNGVCQCNQARPRWFLWFWIVNRFNVNVFDVGCVFFLSLSQSLRGSPAMWARSMLIGGVG